MAEGEGEEGQTHEEGGLHRPPRLVAQVGHFKARYGVHLALGVAAVCPMQVGLCKGVALLVVGGDRPQADDGEAVVPHLLAGPGPLGGALGVDVVVFGEVLGCGWKGGWVVV
jgi:hypothetical protein